MTIHYQDKRSQTLDEMEQNGKFERSGLNAARNEELFSDFTAPFCHHS